MKSSCILCVHCDHITDKDSMERAKVPGKGAELETGVVVQAGDVSRLDRW